MTGIRKIHGASPNCFQPSKPLKFPLDPWDDGTDLGFEPLSEGDDTIEDALSYEMDFDDNETDDEGEFDVNDRFNDRLVGHDVCVAFPWYNYNLISDGSQSGFSHEHRQSKIRSTRAGKHRQQFSLEDLAV